MTSHTRFRLIILLLLILLAVSILLGVTVSAQQADLNEAIKSVVRIRGCNSAGCNVDLGSGVIIDPSGVILTANHVTLTDPKNSLSPHLEDFVIEITEDARKAPQARYRANLIAAKQESDLALLRIYQDEARNQLLDDPTAVHLPALALADVNTIGVGDRLHVLGYPLAGGASINYVDPALGGFDENGTLLKVNASLNEGYSGGPALVEQDGRYKIAGVVIRRRGDVSLIRSIDQLHSLTWEPTARRVWLDNVQITAQGSTADAMVKVSVDIHALDYANRDGRLLAYVFDAKTLQPWTTGDSSLDRSANGQLVLRQLFSATHMVDVLPQQTLTLPFNQLNTQADRLVFRLLLWDINETHVLWRDDQWRRPEQGVSEVAIAPTQTPTFTPSPTSMPTPMATAVPTDMPAPTPTATDTSLPTSTPTQRATATPIPTSTPTPSSTNTLLPTNAPIDTSTPTLDVRATTTSMPFADISLPNRKISISVDDALAARDIFTQFFFSARIEWTESQLSSLMTAVIQQNEAVFNYHVTRSPILKAMDIWLEPDAVYLQIYLQDDYVPKYGSVVKAKGTFSTEKPALESFTIVETNPPEAMGVIKNQFKLFVCEYIIEMWESTRSPTSTPSSTKPVPLDLCKLFGDVRLQQGSIIIENLHWVPDSTPVPTSPSGGATASAAMATIQTALYPCTVVSDSLNLRSGPGTNYSSIRTLALDTKLQPQSRNEDGSWVEVQAINDDQIGWVNAASQYINCIMDINALKVVVTPTPP